MTEINKKIFNTFKILICLLLLIGAVMGNIVDSSAASGIKLKKSREIVYVNNKVKLQLLNASGKVKWVSMNKKVATVSSKGVVTGKKQGITFIKAVYKKKTYKCKITVKKLGNTKPRLVNTNNGIQLNWKKVSGAEGYYIYRKKGSDIFKRIRRVNTLSFLDTAVAANDGVEYSYAICAYKSKSLSTKISEKIIRMNSPQITDTYISDYSNLVVNFNGVNNAALYQIMYSNGVETTTASISKDKLSYTIRNIQDDTKYTISMRCAKGGYYSEWSPITTFSPTEGLMNFSINESSYGTEDVCWSWWSYPQLVSYKDIRNKSYFGYVSSLGYIGVGSYDMDTGVVIKTNLAKSTIDDHNSCSVSVLADGRIMAVYATGHDKDRNIHVRISSQSESITRFDRDIVLKSSGKTCYSQVYHINGKYYIFFRNSSKRWSFFYSSDLVNWSEEQEFISSDVQYYIRLVETTSPNVYRLVCTGNPESADCNIRMGFVNFVTGNVMDSNMKSVGKLGKFVDYRNFDIVIPKEPNRVTRLFDVAVTKTTETEIAYCTWKTSNKKADYKILRNGKTYVLAENSDEFWTKYFGGMSFVDKDNVIVSYGVESEDHIDLMRFGEYTDIIEIKKDDDSGLGEGGSGEGGSGEDDSGESGSGEGGSDEGGSGEGGPGEGGSGEGGPGGQKEDNTETEEVTVVEFRKINEITKTSYKDNSYRSVRPIVDVNGKCVMWQYGYYNSDSYKIFNMDARFCKIIDEVD